MRATIAALTLLAAMLGATACFPTTRPNVVTPEPLVPTAPPRTLPPIVAVQPTATAVRATPTASPTAELAATATASPAPPTSVPATVAATATIAPTRTPTATPTSAAQAVTASTWGLPTSERGRVGVGMPIGGINDYDWGDTPPGWYLNWSMLPRPSEGSTIPFARMVWIAADTYSPDLGKIKAAAAATPGSLWLIGNEPDVPWQGNATPEQYAATYGVLYPAIKTADPTAHVAIGGVSQPTPLRLAYLDRILAAYKAQFGTEMPVDVWNIHAFILREERDSWGVGIPPGMPVDRGTLYEITDHADMGIFKRQIEDFRRWMAEHGQRDKPLVVSEYGILMPEDYGFPPEVVVRFMTDTFDYFLTARDPDLGYAADGNRLVQAFCWYSVADEKYPTPNLFDPVTRTITPVGKAFKQYVAGLK